MFEAYKVGITISLTNQISSALGLISRQFATADVAAVKLRTTLQSIKFLSVSGLLVGGLGYAGFRAIAGMVKPAEEYAHQLNIMNMAGLSQVEIAEAIGAAWKNTGVVMTSTVTGNLKSLLDLRNILTDAGFKPGDPVTMKLATSQLEFISKMQAVMAASKEGAISSQSSDFAFSMAKTLDLMGAVTAESFVRQGTEMGKVITAFQGRVTPVMYQSVAQYARQARYDLSEQFMYELGQPTLMLELSRSGNYQGGGSRGVGPTLARMYSFISQGQVARESLPLLKQLGLLTDENFAQTTTPGVFTSHLKGAALGAQNPFLWTQQVLVPAIQKAFPGASEQKEREIVGQLMRGNMMAASLVMEMITKPANFYRDAAIIAGAMPVNTAFQQAMFKDPKTAWQALSSSLINLKTAFGQSVIPILVPAIVKLAGALSTFSLWAEAHPNLTAGLTDGFIALSAALAFSGIVLTLKAAWLGLSTVLSIGSFSPGVLGVLGARLGSVALGLTAMLGPVALLAGILAYFAPSKDEMSERIEDVKNRKPLSFPDLLHKWNLFGRSGGTASSDIDISALTLSKVWTDAVLPTTGSPLPSGNNPLNLRFPGSKEFRSFATLPEGILAAANQLRRDQNVHHLNTLSQIIGDPAWGWAPASDNNDIGSYIRDVAKQTGFAPNQPLDLSNPAVLAQLEAAMAKHEGAGGVTVAQIREALSGVTVVMEGETVGRLVSNQQARSAQQPPSSTGDYDLRMTRAYPAFGVP